VSNKKKRGAPSMSAFDAETESALAGELQASLASALNGGVTDYSLVAAPPPIRSTSSGTLVVEPVSPPDIERADSPGNGVDPTYLSSIPSSPPLYLPLLSY
jgi:hypothetical protein